MRRIIIWAALVCVVAMLVVGVKISMHRSWLINSPKVEVESPVVDTVSKLSDDYDVYRRLVESRNICRGMVAKRDLGMISQDEYDSQWKDLCFEIEREWREGRYAKEHEQQQQEEDMRLLNSVCGTVELYRNNP